MLMLMLHHANPKHMPLHVCTHFCTTNIQLHSDTFLTLFFFVLHFLSVHTSALSCIRQHQGNQCYINKHFSGGKMKLPVIHWPTTAIVMQPMQLLHEFHEICHSVTFHFMNKRLQTMLWRHNARVNSHQRWKQMRFRVCFHLWCELTSTMNVTEWQVSWNSRKFNTYQIL